MTEVSPARVCALTVVRRVFEQGAYADRALAAAAARLDPRDRALATALAYTTVQRRATLDHVIERLSSRPLRRLDAPTLAALRLGLAQLLLLDGIADHAAVNETVELAKRDSPGGAGLANAVLRRAAREGRTILDALDDATPGHAAVLRSVPRWLAELWFAELGTEEARALLEAVNRPPESAVRVNTLVSDPPTVAAALPVASHPAPGIAEGLVLEGPFDIEGSELWRAGAVMGQSRGSMTPARALGPRPGERVLDLCAAPGAKTGQLAALMADEGRVLAVERHPGRAAALERTLARLRVRCAEVRVADAAALDTDERFDRVLVDPPCSGLGTLQSRPDIRWRVTPERLAALPDLQLRLLRAGAALLAPEGTLVYSVCTISRMESEGVIERFLDGEPGFDVSPIGGARDVGPFVRLLPHRDGTDGFFVARLVRR
ncbi:MAG TPA: 16S rRNA (cytosine(967)-C(5))-methyltransferase RsmB [Solirubrobacteraceae bacterium]|nr:16S rRNA (cytosine(967)-C(5))-methyltransferase RsmB [Solirubrobacteraceae bacterium]